MSISEEELIRRVTFLKVLADKNRLRILGLIAEREYTVKALAEALGITEPTVSHHLGALRRTGVVDMRQEGTAHYYRLGQERIHTLLRDLTEADRSVPAEFAADDEERRTLHHFFANGQLKEIPAQRKKQVIVLRRLVQEFSPGERYHEKQVNIVLKRFHPDCATLRRQLVDNGLMARENSLYWRIDTA